MPGLYAYAAAAAWSVGDRVCLSVRIETDYLVIGAGASGLAFADALVAEADVDVTLVDRRPAWAATGWTRIRSSACTARPRTTA